MTTSGTPAAGDVRRQFGAVAGNYATSAVHASGPDLAALVEAARLTGSEQVLDLGCGAGHTALALAGGAAKVTAVDLTPEMLATAEALAKQRGVTNVEFKLADGAALPFAGGQFDLVASRYAAHHFAEPERVLQEAARVLRPGGRFLLVDTMAPEQPALDTLYNALELLRDGSHVRNWRKSEWQRMADAAGFTTAVRFEMMLHLDGASWVARMQTPPEHEAAIKVLFHSASPTATEFFALRLDEPWSWQIPVALIEGQRA